MVDYLISTGGTILLIGHDSPDPIYVAAAHCDSLESKRVRTFPESLVFRSDAGSTPRCPRSGDWLNLKMDHSLLTDKRDRQFPNP